MYTLNEMLGGLTVDQLKSLMQWLPDTPRRGKKGELVAEISLSLAGEGMRELWDRLDDTQRLAVAETLYAPDGAFHRTRFHAKYGRLPDFTLKERNGRRSYFAAPTALGLFLYYQNGRYLLPTDLVERLKGFVEEPAPVRLNTVDTLPETRGDRRITVRHTERDALADLPVLLRLAEQARIQVSDKTSLPGAATLRLVMDSLADGDFYDAVSGHSAHSQEIGSIKAFAWPMLLQASGLAQRSGSKLALSPAGRTALSTASATVLATIWRKWLKSTLFDEFSRIDAIKGQKSKGRVLTAVPPRRTAIADTLQHCPVGGWVKVDDLSRFMQATDCTFGIAHDPWKLYICEPQYGSLGYDGSHSWQILQLRYLLCILLEYAATLGMIDVAYIDASGARDDFRALWGTDELEFLSRYDGLLYFRLTPLGAHCLGLDEEYRPAPTQQGVRLSVSPRMQVCVVDGQLSTEEALILDTWATKEADDRWRLDRQKALGAVEKGLDIAELRLFLQTRENQPLPDPIEAFIRGTWKQGRALKIVGTTLLIECDSDEIAAKIAMHKESAGLCQRAGDRHLLVRIEHEKTFRRLIRQLGFGMIA
jgi:hypothetical protein